MEETKIGQVYEMNCSDFPIVELPKCILCLSPVNLTKEHIIPESIGGKLKAKILCAECNNDIGSKIYKEICDDISIRIAIIYLSEQLPDLINKFKVNLDFEGKSSDGRVIAMSYNNKNELKCKTLPAEDDSVIYDSKITEKELKNRLVKDGQAESKLENIIKDFNNSNYGEKIQLTETIAVKKERFIAIKPIYTGDSISQKVPVLIAFEFLSLIIGEDIYLEFFNDIREYLLNRQDLPDNLYVTKLQGASYSPEIDIYLDDSEYGDYIKVCIIFFGWLWVEVHFKNVCNFPYYPAIKQNLELEKFFVTTNWKKDVLPNVG